MASHPRRPSTIERAPAEGFFRPVLFVVGILNVILGGFMLVPAAADLMADNPDWQAFALSAATVGFLGAGTSLATRQPAITLNRRQSFLLTALAWTTLPLAGAMPFLFADFGMSPIDAVFEAVSGMTTTGSTVLTGLDVLPPGILLWRSLLQWTGGIGIIVMAIAIVPFLRVGGMQLFRTESSDRYDKALPGAAQMVKAIIGVYTGLTGLCALAYWAGGMSPFDAVNHALTTLPTGGFSTHDDSFGHFDSPLLQWTGALFMIAGALPFTLYVMGLAAGRWRPLLTDAQVRLFLASVGLATGVLTVMLLANGHAGEEALRLAAFHVVSVITTTGYAIGDYSHWGAFAMVIFFYLTFCGACAGSTAGGIKMLRVGVMLETFRVYLRHLVFPSGTFIPRFNRRRIEVEEMGSVMVFVLAFAAAIALAAMILGAFGLDLVTSLTAAATAVANVGPGLGPVVGPATTFASLPDGAKLTLCGAMILGRLEIFTVLVLLSPTYWRN
ncbi:TrkH family potassium uptake protein [Roseospirillum parvum]|uniref:Trk system potassium uptake protein n=1 Tax=Roseospirillum parvum TaxID=83401 RepID=A0A1G8DGP0_9PROT|nr:TrkH family potassium uptake protein [Roseospirillum parvum]SDH56885.1 trk system potassium uptake protein TrkH [Roseospirillum parvum]